MQWAEAKAASEAQRLAGLKDTEIQQLKAKLDAMSVERQRAVAQALNLVEKERNEFKNGLERSQLER